MATQTRVAASYTSIARSGDQGDTWTAGGTLGLVDSNRSSCVAFYQPVALGPYQGKNCATLRVTLAAFGLNPTDTISSASISVTMRQGQTAPDAGGNVVFEGTNTNVTSNPADATVAYSISTAGLTIAALNAGTQTIDLDFHGTGTIAVPLGSGVPFPDVNEVELTVVTTSVPTARILGQPPKSMRRIPERAGVR